MAFVVMQIVEGPRVLKNWYGKSVYESASMIDVFTAFSCGELDNGEGIPDRLTGCKVIAMVSSDRSKSAITVSLDTLVSSILPIGIYITFSVTDLSTVDNHDDTTPSNHESALVRLMAAAKVKKLPKRYDDATANNKQKLSNAIIDWLQNNKLGFSSDCVATLGKELITTLTNTFWYLDGHFKTLGDRGHGVPDMFQPFQGFNKPEASKHRKREGGNLKHSDLSDYSSVLFKICASSYMKGKKSTLNPWIPVRESILRLADNLQKHAAYLNAQSQKMNTTHERKVRRTDLYEWEIYNPSTINLTWQSKYTDLHSALRKSETYEPLFLNDFAPADHRRKFDFLNHLSFPFKVARLSYTSARTHLHFVWKLNPSDNETDLLQKNDEISTELKSSFPKYFSRAIRREFMALYQKVADVKPAVLREIYKNLTGDHTTPTNEQEKQIHQRILECLEGEDDTMVWDLRVKSGRVQQYEPFLEEVQKYINSEVETAVNDRRHDAVDNGQVVTHMATALNARDLYDQVVKRCPEGVDIPSLQWLRWQFWPRNAGKASSKRYTGKIKIRFMVSARQFRGTHPDTHYASATWRYLREFSVKFCIHAKLLSQDDKHTVKIGEPGLPVAAVERGREVLVSKSQIFEVCDHDFTKFSFTPSVTLKVDIPETIEDSFHLGQVFVGLKENAFQPSSCLRHLVEFSTVENSDKPIELHYHDGGPDHNVRHIRNKLSNIAYFLHQNLDMLVSVQTPPTHSWKNPAERVMSILNMGLQSVGIMRKETENYEDILKSAKNLSSIRKLSEKDSAVKEEVIACVQPMVETMESIFMRLTLGEKNFQTFKAVKSEELECYLDVLKRIDESFDPSIVTNSKKSIKDVSLQLQSFIEKHCVQRHYMFSVKKCDDVQCVCGAIRLHQSVFEQLHHLPDPRPSPTDPDRYVSFSESYGRPCTDVPDKHLPSPWVQNKDHGMPFAPSAQAAKNTKLLIQCEICMKWRCIYSRRKFDGPQRNQAIACLDTLSYTCGASINEVNSEDDDIGYNQLLYTSMKLTCKLPIEISYYGAFIKEPLCYYCGAEEGFVKDGEKNDYPLCEKCKDAGKVPHKKQTRSTKS